MIINFKMSVTLQLMSGKVSHIEFVQGLTIGNVLLRALFILKEEGIEWFKLRRVCLFDKNNNEITSWWPGGKGDDEERSEPREKVVKEGDHYYIFAEERHDQEYLKAWEQAYDYDPEIDADGDEPWD